MTGHAPGREARLRQGGPCAEGPQGEQPDHGATRQARRPSGEQRVPGAPERLAWEQLVAIDEIEQRARLALQRMNDVPVIDHVHRGRGFDAAPIRDPAARQGQNRRAAEQALQPIVVEAHAQSVSDQARWHRVEHVAQQKAAVAGDDDHGVLMVGRAAGWQRC